MVHEFSTSVKQLCWEICKKVSGRDPARWRQDANGTPVMTALRGKEGLAGWHYDHIIPKSLGKKMPKDAQAKLSELSNCQILQTRANKKKQANVLHPDVLKNLACDLELTGEFNKIAIHFQMFLSSLLVNCDTMWDYLSDSEMDVVEIAVHGNVTDEKGMAKCMCVSNKDAKLYSGVPPCPTKICIEWHEAFERFPHWFQIKLVAQICSSLFFFKCLFFLHFLTGFILFIFRRRQLETTNLQKVRIFCLEFLLINLLLNFFMNICCNWHVL
jgi:hypothetical protein